MRINNVPSSGSSLLGGGGSFFHGLLGLGRELVGVLDLDKSPSLDALV
jgi:hypothetical protein